MNDDLRSTLLGILFCLILFAFVVMACAIKSDPCADCRAPTDFVQMVQQV
jgi:hypothetical protein